MQEQFSPSSWWRQPVQSASADPISRWSFTLLYSCGFSLAASQKWCIDASSPQLVAPVQIRFPGGASHHRWCTGAAAGSSQLAGHSSHSCTAEPALDSPLHFALDRPLHCTLERQKCSGGFWNLTLLSGLQLFNYPDLVTLHLEFWDREQDYDQILTKTLKKDQDHENY